MRLLQGLLKEGGEEHFHRHPAEHHDHKHPGQQLHAPCTEELEGGGWFLGLFRRALSSFGRRCVLAVASTDGWVLFARPTSNWGLRCTGVVRLAMTPSSPGVKRWFDDKGSFARTTRLQILALATAARMLALRLSH